MLPDLVHWSAELAFDARAELGEAPHWDSESGELVWVDILAGAVHRLDLTTGADRHFGLGQPVGAAVPRSGGGYVVAVRDGIATVDEHGAGLEWLSAVERESIRTRMNDAKCDPAGRLWAGTMDFDEREPIGALYRLSATHELERVVSGVTVSNGLGWSPDGNVLYYIDSARFAVDAFDFDMASGAVANRRRLIAFGPDVGEPDGLTVDAEGCIWVALWNGWAVRRFTPGGELVGIAEIPAERVTCPTFGDGDLGTIYVTTARPDSPDPRQPHAGGMFRFRPGCTGLPAHRFAG